MSSPFPTDLQNTLVRMVVPMRREFGRALDVQQMRSDRAYAESIVAQALTSQVQSLRDHARLVGVHLNAADAATDAQRIDTERTTAHEDAALAARQLIDLVGPMGEALAIRIERARDTQALEKSIADARSLIARVRGEAAASGYMQHTVRNAAPSDGSAHGSSASLRRSARLAARELVALIGPLGEELAERIEIATDMKSLTALVDKAHQGISAVIGAAAANDFMRRVT
jgi:hypothetical protein